MLELTIALVLIALNGVFALSELAIVSARKPRLKVMAEAGRSGARAALALAEDPGRFLSTVQIGITLVGILAGAYSGAALGGAADRDPGGPGCFAPSGGAARLRACDWRDHLPLRHHWRTRPQDTSPCATPRASPARSRRR